MAESPAVLGMQRRTLQTPDGHSNRMNAQRQHLREVCAHNRRSQLHMRARLSSAGAEIVPQRSDIGRQVFVATCNCDAL